METIIKDLKLLNQNLNIIPGEFADPIVVSDAMGTLDIMGDLQNSFIVEGEQLTVERNEGSYSLNCEFLPSLVKRFSKKLIKTEKQILSHAIKHDKRHLKYAEWYGLIKTLDPFFKINVSTVSILNPLLGFEKFKKSIGGLMKLIHIVEFITKLPEKERSSFLAFYKEQTK